MADKMKEENKPFWKRVFDRIKSENLLHGVVLDTERVEVLSEGSTGDHDGSAVRASFVQDHHGYLVTVNWIPTQDEIGKIECKPQSVPAAFPTMV